MTEPVKCRCGDIAEVYGWENIGFKVLCFTPNCWRGPKKPSKEAAIRAWNSVMGKEK